MAFVGASAPAERSNDALVKAIAGTEPDVLLFTGGMVPRSSSKEWERAVALWQPLADRGVLATPGSSERTRDPKLRGFHSVFPDMGVPSLGGEVSFGHHDLLSEGVRWRIIRLDADSHHMGNRWLDQLFWLPKVLTPGDHDALIVVINLPLVSLSDPRKADPRGDVSTLLDVVTAYASPTALTAVIMGGAPSNEVHLPAGDYGELHLIAGSASGPAEDLWRAGISDIPGRDTIELAHEFDSALRSALEERVEAGRAGPLAIERWARGVLSADALPVRGWWELTVRGRAIAVRFHLEQSEGRFTPVFAMHHSRRRGWIVTEREGD